ncbi:MAG TPA: hypothetical protein VGL38_08080 [bacterium]|jgi:hypothetical protein
MPHTNVNPFTIRSPEKLPADDAVRLFVDVFSDFPKVAQQGHCFIHGPRGSGKSMIFRFLEPDCQCLSNNTTITNLDFLSIWVQVKNTELCLSELDRLKDEHSSLVLNEHFMILYIASKAFEALSALNIPDSGTQEGKEANAAFVKGVLNRLRLSGWKGDDGVIESNDHTMSFRILIDILSTIYAEFLQYVKRLFNPGPHPYDGPLLGYGDFLLPTLMDLKKLPYIGAKPVYLLIDDAGHFNLSQTMVLNSWVSSRTSSDVSIKVSTQYDYKTFRTGSGRRIDVPHDFSEIDISEIYTTSHGRYKKRLREIVRRRLQLLDIDVEPDDFFPPDLDQERQITAIAESYKERATSDQRDYKGIDDAKRYARPDFIKRLEGISKSGSTYSYAGFEQLTHISSGVIRIFLDAAAMMYSEATVAGLPQPISAIPAGIQDREIRKLSDKLAFWELEKESQDQSRFRLDPEDLRRLHNMIRVLGGVFHQILVSDKAERRVFSIAFSNDASRDVEKILRLGRDLGYFHVSSIGNKMGTGRTRLYVLTRQLAPHFRLDPTSFAGYLFVTNERMEEAMSNPNAVLRKAKENPDILLDTQQLALFEGED